MVNLYRVSRYRKTLKKSRIRDRFILVNQFSIKIDRNLKFLCRTVFKAMLLPRLFLIDIRNRFRKINLFFPDIANYDKAQLDHEIWSEEQRFENPHTHYIDMSKKLYDTNMELLIQARGENKTWQK